jgi:hypothetical protein
MMLFVLRLHCTDERMNNRREAVGELTTGRGNRSTRKNLL